jgi:hypothetical protein
MTFITPEQSTFKTIQPILYSRSTVERAERALCCTSFKLPLFITMQQQSVELRAIAGKAGLKNGYTDRFVAEVSAESDLVWLIQVGLLRREVDGQGLTDSFRLTPLGHQLLERWQMRGNIRSQPSLSDRLYNSLSRWARLPSWMQF